MLSSQSSSTTPGYAGYAYARDPTASNERVQGPLGYDDPTFGGPGTSVAAAPMDISGPIGGLQLPPQRPLHLAPLGEGDPLAQPSRQLVRWGMPNDLPGYPRTVITEETQRWRQHYPGAPNVIGDVSPGPPQAPRVAGVPQRKGPKVVTPPSEASAMDREVLYRAPKDMNAEPTIIHPPLHSPGVGAASTVLPSSSMQGVLQKKTGEVVALRKERNHLPSSPPAPPTLRYEMNCRPHGVAVIFAIDEVMFTPGVEAPQPPSSQVAAMDKTSLALTLHYLGYRVETYANLTAADISRKMRTVANRDHTQFDSFICCIVGCGTEEGVYGCDGEIVPLQEIVATLKGNSCPTLVGKPKMFFLQLNQGDAVDEGVQIQTRSLEPDAPEGTATVHSEADFFFAHAAVAGYQACSDDLGSYFIRTLTDVITERAQLSHLADILTEVSQRMAQKAPKDGSPLQLPRVVSQLRKQVWFFFD